jgi:hypothetical protein
MANGYQLIMSTVLAAPGTFDIRSNDVSGVIEFQLKLSHLR